MPTPYEYSCFSMLAYPEDSGKNLLPLGWRQANQETEPNEDGYHAKVFVNVDKKELVIAHCGTRANLLGNLFSDFQIAKGDVPRSAQRAEEFSIGIRAIPRFKEYDISETGHSLGGIYAQLNAYLFGCKAVTFDNPGSLELIRNLKAHKEAAALTNLPAIAEIDPNQFVEYLSAPHFINVTGTHIGKLIRIYPYHLELEGHQLEDIMEVGIKATLLIAFIRSLMQSKGNTPIGAGIGGAMLAANTIYNTLKDLGVEEYKYINRLHSIHRISQLFHEGIGESYLQAQVNSWPSLEDLCIVKPWAIVRNPYEFFRYRFRLEPQRIELNRVREEQVKKIPNYNVGPFIVPNALDFNRCPEEEEKLAYIKKSCEKYVRFFPVNTLQNLKVNLLRNASFSPVIPLNIDTGEIEESEKNSCPCPSTACSIQ